MKSETAVIYVEYWVVIDSHVPSTTLSLLAHIHSHISLSFQLCEEQDGQLEIFKTENDKIALERDSLMKEKNDLLQKNISLETQVSIF